jgi:hypothetical protein
VGRAALLSQRGAVCGVKFFGPAAQVAGEGPFAETWLLHCSFPLEVSLPLTIEVRSTEYGVRVRVRARAVRVGAPGPLEMWVLPKDEGGGGALGKFPGNWGAGAGAELAIATRVRVFIDIDRPFVLCVSIFRPWT